MPRRTASQVELPLGLEAYRNTALFSDHYLADRLPQLPWFTDRRRTASRAAYDAIHAIYNDLRPEEQLPGAPEEQVEDDLVRPILEALGHHYLLRPPTTAGGTKNFPDYALFKNAEDRNAARTEVSANDYSRAIALCEAKHWDRDLDRSGPAGRDYLTNANPSFQIVNYLIQTGRRWGILTNGRLWRLYCRDSPQPLERFYEVDLPRLISQSGADAFFTYFYGFFSAEALRPAAGGLAHVDNVRAGSASFAQDVGEELRSRVFGALVRLAAGFLKGREEPVPEEALDEVYDNALIVLYRLLFILFAEARELLPLETSPSYAEQISLARLVREVADKRERRITFSSTSTGMWDRLVALWTAIDNGDTDLHVARYDGELFAAGAHPFLDQHKIPDLYLAEALDLISRVPGLGEARFVDYRALSVTHLGTVYEGLLEHRLRVVPDRLGEVEDRIELAAVSGRRRETGSYYTPDPIVRFIVSETLGPLVEGRDEQAILDLRVVDPAMGSGHFLVAAVEFLALAIATHPGRPEPIDVDEDLAAIKRRVVERCVWGVDINPLAVELAKLSLWLATASTDKPLTFLDHRLREGNSVMSMRRDDVLTTLRRGRHPGAVTVFEAAFAEQHQADLDLAARLDGTDPDSLEGVEARRELFARQDASRRRLRTLWNAAVGLICGTVRGDAIDALAAALQAPEPEWDEAAHAAEEQGLPSGDDYTPFHWELEFAEAFERGGFDAVLGNPPYVSAWEMTNATPGLRDGLAQLPRWTTVARRHWDLFVLFVALGEQLLVPNGVFGIIVANPVMRERYAEALRAELLSGRFLAVVDFGEANVFQDVARETVVLIWQKTPAAPDHLIDLYDPDSIVAA